MTETQKKGLNPIKYVKEAKEELDKVTWPSKKDAIRYSLIVIAVTVALSAFFAILDWALNLGLGKLIEITQ
ncbi:MAG: preprotein translocase subunit SecE [Patescibacteria group bacterium]|jgi:preprotein translocase subunit SecE